MSLLSSIAKIALPAVQAIPGMGTVASAAIGGLGAAISDTASAKATQADFNNQKALQDQFNIFSASQAQKAMDFSNQQAEKQMGFQERMSNTAHQREMDDLAKAGINPILTAKYGGSSTPSGAAGTGAQPSNLQSPAQTKASATAARHALLAEKSLQAEIDLKQAQAQATRASAGHSQAQTTELTHMQKERIEQHIALAFAQTGNQSAQTVEATFRSKVMRDVTLPNGKIDIEKAKLVVAEMQILYDTLKKNPSYAENIIANRGGHLSGSSSAVLNIIGDTINSIAEKLKSLDAGYGENLGEKFDRFKSDFKKHHTR